MTRNRPQNAIRQFQQEIEELQKRNATLTATLQALVMHREANNGAGCWCNQKLGDMTNFRDGAFQCRNTGYCKQARAALAAQEGIGG